MARQSKLIVPCPKTERFLPYQAAGVEYMLDKHGILFADEQGLGKTPMTIGFINITKPRTVLIVCPNSLKINWNRELKRWLTTPYSITMVSTKIETNFREPGIYIINYDIISKYRTPLYIARFDLMICDEFHYCKNERAKRSIAVYDIMFNATTKIGITGTPIMNKPFDLFPLIHNLLPEYWTSKLEFIRNFVVVKKGFRGLDMSGGKNLDILQKLLRESLMLRRMKRDVLKNLPPKRRQIIELPAEGKLRAAVQKETTHIPLFRTILRDFETYEGEAFEQSIINKRNIFKFMQHVAKVRHDTALIKVPQVCSFVENLLEEKEKVVVFAHHIDVTDAIKAHFKNICVSVVGADSIAERQQAIDAFQNDPKKRVLIGSFQPAGSGWTMTAADTLVFAELDWVPAVMEQCEDRIHRYGQNKMTTIYYIVIENSIDYYIAKTITKKLALIKQALNKEGKKK